MFMSDEEAFRAFVVASSPTLLRSAGSRIVAVSRAVTEMPAPAVTVMLVIDAKAPSAWPPSPPQRWI
jgi:hypothetical protein